MFKRKKICVVIPAYNEEKLIGRVIKTMPRFVDLIIIVDDKSKDKTIIAAKDAAKKYKRKLDVVVHEKNQGVGAAIVTGYKHSVERKMDVVAVMAGDAQMNPDELKDIIAPIVLNEADYVKGNRLIHGQAWRMIPKVRYLGNSVLSLLTKITSGYWHVADSQTGYTAISQAMIKKIELDNLYKRYGFPNDILIHLNIHYARVKEIPIKPIYHVGEKSGIRLWKVIPTISWLLTRRFFWRLKRKYIIDNFHPLVFFYLFAVVLVIASLFLLFRLLNLYLDTHRIPPINALALVFCLVMSGQFGFFAMWLDMDDNRELRVK